MVYKHAGKLLAYGACQQHGGHGRIYPAGKGAQHAAAAHAGAQGGHSVVHKGIHLPCALAAAHIIHKV